MQYIDCYINPITRKVTYPGATIVQRDTHVEALRFHFALDAEYTLENDTIRIMVQKQGDPVVAGFSAENVRTETNDGGDQELVFEHTITTFETATAGQINVSVCGILVSGNVLTEAWHTLNMSFQVASAVHSNSDEGEDTPETMASNAEKIAVLQNIVTGLASGTPVPAATAADMTDDDTIYLYTGNETGYQTGYWYYNNGTTWVPGSKYGYDETDTTLSVSGVAADAGAVGDALDEVNGRLPSYPLAVNVVDGSYVVGSTGGIDTNANLSYAEVSVLAFRGKGITIQSYLWEGAGFAFLDVNGAYIYGESANTKGITPDAGVLTKVETSVPYNAYSLRVTLHQHTYAANANRYFFTIGENKATKVVFISDSYGTGFNTGGTTTGWIPGTAAALGLKSSDFESHAKGGAGFRHPANITPYETFTDLLNLSTLAKAEVGKIVVCGGYNEQLYTVSQLLEAFGTFAAKARTMYPFAEICIGMIGHSGTANEQETLMNTVRQAYMQMANRAGVRYLSNVEYVLTDDNVSSDGVHPDQTGADNLATAIGNAVKTGSASGKSYQSEITELDGRLEEITEIGDYLTVPDVSSDGLTVENNQDGSITINGVLSSTYTFTGVTLKSGKYTAKITKVSGSTTASNVNIRYGEVSTSNLWAGINQEVTKDFSEETNAFLRLNSGTYTNLCLTINIFDVSANDKTARARINTIDEGIADLPEIRAGAKTALDIPLNISTEIGYFSTDDLRENVTQNKRARTGVFRIYKPSVLRLSVTDGSFAYYVFKQTFTDGVQTTTALTSSWTGNIEYYVLDADPNANYRIMLRKDGGNTSLVNYDFSQLYITCENVEPATPYLAEETRFYNEVNKAIGNNTIIAVLNTDNHYNDADYRDCLQVKYANAIAKMGQRASADFIVNLGDMVEGFNDNLTVEQYNQQYSNYKRIAEMVNALTSTEIPLIYAVGHHEMFPISDSFGNGVRTEHRGYTMANVYRQIFGEMDNNAQLGFRRSLKTSCIDDDPTNGLSFYFDFTKNSGTIRFLVIDGCDYSTRGYSNETISFVTTALQDAKTNSLPVIILCHIPPISAGVINESTTPARNEAALNEAINGVGANILAWLHGHVHCDNVITDMTNYPIVAFDAQKLYRQWSTAPNIHGTPSCPARAVGTYTEYAFDVVLIDTVTHEIDCYRFGAGDNGTYPTRSIGE